jgi:hypothetical protein
MPCESGDVVRATVRIASEFLDVEPEMRCQLSPSSPADENVEAQTRPFEVTVRPSQKWSRETVMGKEHPNTLASRGNLVNIEQPGQGASMRKRCIDKQ